jgi:DNA invertase Pin-like site-specific DNA recombinase
MTDSSRTANAARAARTRPLALAYTRVSTADQVEHGSSLDAQEAMLIAEATRRGWDVEVVREEGKSAKNVTGRPLLTDALLRLDAGHADVLLAVRLDRVSRSLSDFSNMYDRAQRRGWSLVLPSSGIDTGAVDSPAALFSAQVQAAAAQLERGLISVRVKEGMAQRKAEGATFGRPPRKADKVSRRIARDRARGMTLAAIATALNAEGVPTSHGGARWHPSTVRAVLAATT